VELVWPALEKRIEAPEVWFAEVLKSVRNPKISVKSRTVLISLLGEESDTNDKARRALTQLLVADRTAEIRAECADALEKAVGVDSKVAQLLLERLDKDNSELVRARCAQALHSLAPNQAEVRVRLEQLLASAPELVRVGAVRGLWQLDFASVEQKPLLERLLATIASPIEPARVRCASIWSVASLLGKNETAVVNRIVEECLDDQDPNIGRVAAHALADAISEGRREWSQPLVEKIETMLIAATNPCSHIYGALLMIVAMKEIHGGRRLKSLLGDALTPFDDFIKIAFVFGSVARLEQIRESDIDLMVVGDVRLKDLAAALHMAEQTLGRAVNPVLFSSGKFRDQYREGNPLLLDVVRKEKIYLKGTRDELTELVADRSPD
jgi:predicted nucleotidyltransferase